MLIDMLKEVEQRAGTRRTFRAAEIDGAGQGGRRAVRRSSRDCAARLQPRRPRARRLSMHPFDRARSIVGGDATPGECAGLLWHDFASFAALCFREINPRTPFNQVARETQYSVCILTYEDRSNRTSQNSYVR
jgi:hypothetical protein